MPNRPCAWKRTERDVGLSSFEAHLQLPRIKWYGFEPEPPTLSFQMADNRRQQRNHADFGDDQRKFSRR
jgi:hypothetical protein